MLGAFRVLLSVLLAAGMSPAARAGSMDNFRPLPGWVHATPFEPSDSPFRHGVLLDAPAVMLHSPLVADIDGNPANGLEVAFGTVDGVVHVLGANGAVRWETSLVPPSCDRTILPLSIMPTVAPIFGDGVPHLLVGFGGDAGGSCDGGLAAIAGATGQIAWRFSTLEWQKQQGYPNENLHGVVVSPAVADTDGDGRMEIAFGAYDRHFYLLDADGSVRWYYQAADTVWSSPVFAQIDDDPQLEVITASDVTLGKNEGGGYLQAFDTAPHYPLQIKFNTGFIWRTPNLGQVPWSSPAIADLLPDEPGDEIAIGTGCYFPPSGGDRPGDWVKIFRARDGAELQTLHMPAGGTCGSSSPAVGDIDDDGKLEIVVTNGDPADASTDGIGRIVAWDPENPTPKWSTALYNSISPPGDPEGNDENAGFFMSPVLADLDGNGSLEVVVGNHWSVDVLEGKTGTPLTCQSLACGAQPTMFAWGIIKSTPAVADVDGDGTLDVVIGGMHVYSPAGGGFGASERAVAYAWTAFAGLRSSPGLQPPYAAPWPMFHGRPDDRPVGSGGRPSDVCLTTPDPSFDRLACRLEQLDAAGELCTITPRLKRSIARARRFIKLAGPQRARKMLKRASRAFLKAQRVADMQLTDDCRTDVRTRLQELSDVALALSAAS